MAPDPEVVLTNGAGEVGTLDLAETQVTKGPPMGEVGSQYSGERLFYNYDDGKVFETRDFSTTDFEEMLRRDGQAKTLKAVLTLPLRSAEYAIEPAQGDSGEAEFVRDALTKPANAGGMSTPLELVIAQMTSASIFRRAYFEKVFVIDGGRVRYDKLALRPARTCSLRRDRKTYAFRGFTQRFLKDGDFVSEVIPADKAFVYIHGQEDDPLNGTSDLETARSLYEAKQKVRFLWYSFLENQTIPKAIAKHSTPDIDQQQEFATRVASLKGGGVVGIGPDQSVTPFEPSDAAAGVFLEALTYLDSEMSGSVLAGFVDLAGAAAQGAGSFALSKDQTDFFLMSRLSELKEMAAALTSWVLADLCRWNFGTKAAVPTFKFNPPAPESVEASISLLQSLATAAAPVAVPHEFIDLLTVKVAGYLGINPDEVRKAIEKQQAQAPQTPSDQLRAGIDAATALVHHAGIAPDGSQPSAAPAAAAA
jgi:hypothetical protein